MAGGDKIVRVWLMEVVPKHGWSSPNQSVSSHTSTSRAAYNDNNYKCSRRHTKTHKAGDYVTRSGDVGYKKEARATSTMKFTDKAQGITTEYQTQVTVKKLVYPSASSNKRVNYY